jgi:hypothetical protein
MEKKNIINVMKRAKNAQSGPPLGTVLGNIGVNAVKFAKEFNEFTNELPDYFKIKVQIDVYRNNSYVFNVKRPTIGYIISLLRKDDFSVDFMDLLKLGLFIFPDKPLQWSIKIILGCVKSCNLKINIKK